VIAGRRSRSNRSRLKLSFGAYGASIAEPYAPALALVDQALAGAAQRARARTSPRFHE
jgi:hypothetical protein